MAGSSSSGGSPFVPGTLIAGKYRLIKLLGEGAMGVVWSAVNEMTSGEVALKLILKPEPEYRVRLLREAKASCAVRHKNVIQINDVGQTDAGDPFLVMELLSGETLADLLARKRRLSPAEAAGIGRDVARGLAAAHAKGIVHRDLKPANIYLHNQPGEDYPVVKVLDFGVAKNLALNDGLRTAIGGAVGSPMYMSPEQARRAPDIDARADIWSLGVVLFEMLTGDRPFRGDLTEVLQQVLTGDIPTVARRIRKIDPDLDAIVAGCLERDREKRLGPASEVARYLDDHGTPGGREPLPSLVEEALSDRLAASGGSPSSSSPAGFAPTTGSGGLQPSSSPGYGRAPEARPSNSGSGQGSPGYGAGQSPGFSGSGQSPGLSGSGQSPAYSGSGRGGIGLTPAGPPVQGGLHQSGSYGVTEPMTAPITQSPSYSGARPPGAAGPDDDAATHRLQPRMLAPSAGLSMGGGDIGPSGTVRIDPNAVEQAILARGAVPGAPAPLAAPPAPVSSPGAAPPTRPLHPTLPLVPGGAVSSTAPMFQDGAAPRSLTPVSGSPKKAGGGRSVLVAIAVALVAAGLAVVIALFGFPGKTSATPAPGSTATATAAQPTVAPLPPPATATATLDVPTPAPQTTTAAPTGDPAPPPPPSTKPAGKPAVTTGSGTKPGTPAPRLTGTVAKPAPSCTSKFGVGCTK